MFRAARRMSEAENQGFATTACSMTEFETDSNRRPASGKISVTGKCILQRYGDFFAFILQIT
jgi:hypothetical protein